MWKNDIGPRSLRWELLLASDSQSVKVHLVHFGGKNSGHQTSVIEASFLPFPLSLTKWVSKGRVPICSNDIYVSSQHTRLSLDSCQHQKQEKERREVISDERTCLAILRKIMASTIQPSCRALRPKLYKGVPNFENSRVWENSQNRKHFFQRWGKSDNLKWRHLVYFLKIWSPYLV